MHETIHVIANIYFDICSEQEILREEITSVNAVKSRQALRIQELEDDIKRLKQQMEGMEQKGAGGDDEVCLVTVVHKIYFILCFFLAHENYILHKGFRTRT